MWIGAVMSEHAGFSYHCCPHQTLHDTDLIINQRHRQRGGHTARTNGLWKMSEADHAPYNDQRAKEGRQRE